MFGADYAESQSVNRLAGRSVGRLVVGSGAFALSTVLVSEGR